MTKIFFYEPGVNIKKYLKKGYELVQLNELNKYDYIDWIYFSSKSIKKYKELLYNISSEISNGIIFEENNIFNKYYLHQIVRNNNKEIYKKYFVNQILIESNKNIKNFMKKGKLYIVKPTNASGGTGVKVFNNSEKLKRYISDFKITNINKQKLLKSKVIKKWIVEEYIDKPLLISDKKFHIRVLCLILIKNNKHLFYLFDKFFIYTAMKKYTLKKLNKNIHDSHISTNSELKKAISEYNKLDPKILHHIRDQVIYLCKYIKTLLLNMKCYPKTTNCNQYIGFDFMVTDDYQVKLIEVNQRPGIKGPSLYPSFWKGLLNITLYNKEKNKNYIKL